MKIETIKAAKDASFARTMFLFKLLRSEQISYSVFKAHKDREGRRRDYLQETLLKRILK